MMKISNKKINKLALAIGHLYGDGGITSTGRVHYCNSEDFLIKEFINSMKVFGIEPWIKKEKNITRVVYPVKIGKKLWDIFGKFSYGKDTKRITSQIEKMPLKWKTKMLQTWFNDDGSVPGYKVIAIKQKLKNLIIFIGNILSEFNISYIICKDEGRWHLRICGYKNMIKFRDKIGFSENYRKTKKLNEIIGTIVSPYGITKSKILELLNKSPKTLNELSNHFNLNHRVIYCHLHGWKRKNRKSNLGLIDLCLVNVQKQGKINIYSKATDFSGSDACA